MMLNDYSRLIAYKCDRFSRKGLDATPKYQPNLITKNLVEYGNVEQVMK